MTAIHSELENKLKDLGFKFVKEYNAGRTTLSFVHRLCTIGIFTVDYYLTEHKIGIEVDGPSHFICPSGDPSGSTKAKHRYLATKLAKFYVITGNFLHRPESSIDAVL